MYRLQYSSKTENRKTRDIFKIVSSTIETCYSKLGIMECYVDECGTIVALIYGGLNGKGQWSRYFDDLSDLIIRLLDEVDDVWLIKLDNDCLDDVFYAYLGIRV